MAEDNAAERSEEEADAEGREGCERAHRWANLWEKFAVEHQCGGNAVQQKIVPVDDGAGKASPCRTTSAMKRSNPLPESGEISVESMPVLFVVNLLLFE